MDRPLRVMYVLNSPGGGATQGIIELLKGLDPQQYAAYIISPTPPDTKRLELFSRLAVDQAVIKMGWWNRQYQLPAWKRAAIASSTGSRTLLGAASVVSLCRKIRNWEIDLVHTSTALTWQGGLAARLCRKPHVWHVREWIGQRGLFKFWLPDPWLVHTFNLLADRIVPMSRFAGSVFFEQNAAGKVQVIYDGVACAEFDGPDRSHELRQRLGVAPHETLVAMVANVGNSMKRHEIFIEMAARIAPRLPHARFAVFGGLPTESSRVHDAGMRYAAQLKELVGNLGLGQRFIWAGFQEDIPAAMAALDILVHPCEVEGFGRIAIEAMAARRPVVGPDRGGISESVVPGCTGYLVEPGDVEAFAEAVSKLVRDPDLRIQMGTQGRRRVESRFPLQRHVQQVTSLYEEVLSRIPESSRAAG